MDVKEYNLDVFIMTDQPTTCSKCGSRTDFEVFNNLQHHICLNKNCRYQFLIEDK